MFDSKISLYLLPFLVLGVITLYVVELISPPIKPLASGGMSLGERQKHDTSIIRSGLQNSLEKSAYKKFDEVVVVKSDKSSAISIVVHKTINSKHAIAIKVATIRYVHDHQQNLTVKYNTFHVVDPTGNIIE